MRKIGLLLGACLMLIPIAAPTGAAPGQQSVAGTILFPNRHPQGGCYDGLTRHLTSLFGEASNGFIGWAFRVDKKTWKKPFTLEGSGVGNVDLDLTFYLGEFATRDEWIANPAPAPPGVVNFEERDKPGEAGEVPEGSIWATVCVYADEAEQPPSAVAVDFTYTAGKGVKVPK